MHFQRSEKYVLTQIFFITSEAELDYYHQKVTIPVTSRVTERLKTFVIGKYQENTEMVGIQGKYPASHPRRKFWQLC